MTNPGTKELLKKYINQYDACTPNELLEITQYINTPLGKIELEKLLLDEWQSFNPDEVKPHEVELWYNRIISSGKKKHLKLAFTSKQWMKYAAILLLFLGASFFTIKIKNQKPKMLEEAMVECINPVGQRSRILLPDSSVVYLGPSSRLKYSRSFAKSRRDVSLSGDAFFEVKHDTQKPFVVHTGNLETQVLGTSFNIDAVDPQKTAVSVATGKVGVINTKNKIRETLAILTPGQRVSWNGATKELHSDRLDVDEIKTLKTGLIAFSNESLENIALKLERWYNIKIAISNPKIRKYTISIKVDGNKSINGALDAISAATKLKYKIHNHQITIS